MGDERIAHLNANGIPEPTVPLTHGLIAGGWLYVSGMVPRAPDGRIVENDAKQATIQCLENLLAVVVTAGGVKEDIVKTNVYLADFGDYASMNEAYREFFSAPFPTRTTIQAGALGIGTVEIDGVAYLGRR